MSVFTMSEINVLYTFDTRFWKLATVSIYSLLKNKNPDTNVTIYCMVAPHTNGRKKLQKIINKFPHTKLIWQPVHKYKNPFRTHDYDRWSPVIFYRLFPYKFFPTLNKILYLDSDTLVQGDLSDLYNTDISEYVLGAVPDMAPVNDSSNANGQYVKEFAQKHLNNGTYFNSGVLLINLKKLSKNEQLLKNIQVDFKYPDQNIINAALVDKIARLELKYNLAPNIKISKTFSVTDADTAKHAPAILHFYAGKPYDYEHNTREIYSLFYKTSAEIAIYPEDLMSHELKYLRRRNRPNHKTNIPFMHINNNKITLFGLISIKL